MTNSEYYESYGVNDLPEIQIAKLPSGNIGYREQGKGENLVFLHGMNGSSASWLYQFEYFSSKYRMITVDIPCYGSSDIIEGDVDSYASILIDFFQHLNLENVHLVGHSMGGIVAGRIAILQPELLKKLILSCSYAGRALEKGLPLMPRYAERIVEFQSLSQDAFARLRAEKMAPKGAQENVLAFLTEICKGITLGALKFVGRASQEANNLDGFRTLKLPVFLLNGTKDNVIKEEYTAALMEVLPQCQRLTLEGLGHSPYVESPSLYNAVLEQALEG